jgi:hypothetical protein
LVASVVFGAIGTALILVGVLIDEGAVILIGCAVGVLSLIAALIWRSQLIEAWRQKQRGS